MPAFGPTRTERPLGLHPRPCRRCTPTADRLVTHRRWAVHAFSLPLLALDAHWTTCTRCNARSATPRLSLPTVVLATLVLATLFGRGWTSSWTFFALVGLATLWGVWMIGYAWDRALDRRLVPLPALPRPRPVRRPSIARRIRSMAVRRVNRMMRPVARLARLGRRA